MAFPPPLGNMAVEALLMEIVKCEMKYSSFGFTVTSLTDVMLGCNNGSRRYYVTGWNDRCLQTKVARSGMASDLQSETG